MKTNTRTVYFTVLIVLGVALVLLANFTHHWDVVPLGTALFAVGLCRIVRQHRIQSSPERAQQYNIAVKDERNRYLAARAIQWTFWISTYAACFTGLILFYFVSNPVWKSVGTALCMLVCAQCLLYVVLYYVFQRKY